VPHVSERTLSKGRLVEFLKRPAGHVNEHRMHRAAGELFNCISSHLISSLVLSKDMSTDLLSLVLEMSMAEMDA